MPDLLAALDGGRVCPVGCLAGLVGAALWLAALRRSRNGRGPDGHRATCAVHWGESCSCDKENP